MLGQGEWAGGLLGTTRHRADYAPRHSSLLQLRGVIPSDGKGKGEPDNMPVPWLGEGKGHCDNGKGAPCFRSFPEPSTMSPAPSCGQTRGSHCD